MFQALSGLYSWKTLCVMHLPKIYSFRNTLQETGNKILIFYIGKNFKCAHVTERGVVLPTYNEMTKSSVKFF